MSEMLEVKNLTVRFGQMTIVNEISFSVSPGEWLMIIGPNGAGKSTINNAISRAVPYTGTVLFEGKDIRRSKSREMAQNIGVLSQNHYVGYGFTVEEVIRLGRYAHAPGLLSGGKDEGEKKVRDAIQKTGMEPYLNQSVLTLSGGELQRTFLAQLFAQDPRLLILDEPTNHLDIETMTWLEGHLAGYKKTLLLVSHDRYFLDRVTNKTLDIENHKAKLYKCAYTEYKKQKEEQRAALEKQYIIQQREIARLEAFIEQQRRWNRERNIIAAESREKAIARMDKVEKPEDAPKTLQFAFSKAVRSGNDVLDVKKLAVGFGSENLFSDLSFSVKRGERLIIAGPNGCGKSTLLKTLLGKLTPRAGRLEFGYNVHIGYYDQENQNLSPEKTVLDELWDAYPTIGRKELFSVLAVFMFRGEDVEKTVSVLSGGERARLTLAKLILSKVNVLILDEPTNHLDIASREALENALEAFEGTVIAVSHDRYFIRRLATRILSLENPVQDFRGGYEEYIAASQGVPEEASPAAVPVSSGKEQYLKKKEEQAAVRRKEARRKKVAAEIVRLEKELADITDRLYGEDAADYVKAAELEDQRIYVEDQLMQLYEEEESFSKAEDMNV